MGGPLWLHAPVCACLMQLVWAMHQFACAGFDGPQTFAMLSCGCRDVNSCDGCARTHTHTVIQTECRLTKHTHTQAHRSRHRQKRRHIGTDTQPAKSHRRRHVNQRKTEPHHRTQTPQAQALFICLGIALPGRKQPHRHTSMRHTAVKNVIPIS